MERRQLQDFPDEWYEIINKEVASIYKKLKKYPSELDSIILQSLYQNFIYDNFDKATREEYLSNVFDAFILTFDQWDSQQSQ